MKAPRIILALILAGYAVLGLVVLSPDAVYSGDIGVKFVQARSLAAHRFMSLDLAYPGEFIDRGREFFPIRPPFVIQVAGETQAIFSPMAAMIQAAAVSAAGVAGMTVTSLIAAAIILYSTARLAEPRLRVAVLAALGVASPLWFYAISGWEHAPAVAFSTAAFALAVVSRMRAAPFVAGLLLGAGGTLRDEVLLLLPGLLLMIRCARGGIAPVVAGAIGVIAPLVGAALIEVVWFNRPVAAHLRHAVHLLQSAAQLTDAPNPEVPSLAPMTLRERYEAVVQYWMFGYGRDGWIIGYITGLAVALLVRWRLRSSVGILLWVIAVVLLAWTDVWELLNAPKWLAGLHRVSPYLVFAILPAPPDGVSRGWFPRAVVFTAAAYLLIAFAGTDTSGGKSLGPRLLLPLFPLLTVVAADRIRAYLDAQMGQERWIGRAGVVLVLMAVTMHVTGTIPAYVRRNDQDGTAVRAVAALHDRIVVADDMFTAQLLFPLYYRKIVFLADSPPTGPRLGQLLAEHRIRSVVAVTRWAETPLDLTPFTKSRTELKGRMLIQYWLR